MSDIGKRPMQSPVSEIEVLNRENDGAILDAFVTIRPAVSNERSKLVLLMGTSLQVSSIDGIL